MRFLAWLVAILLLGVWAADQMRGVPIASERPSKTSSAQTAPYRFTATNSDGSPARWNPCGRPHAVLVNLAGAPIGAMADLATALSRVDQVSGLRFEIVARTSLLPTNGWGQTTVSGRWPPVLIGWRSLAATADAGDAALTTPVWTANATGKLVFVSAAMIFNSDDNSLYHSGQGGTMSRVALIEHELGHLAGLDDQPGPELMNPLVGSLGSYQPGDIRGLTLLGRGGCLMVPRP